MRGAYGAGAALALEELGHTNAFSYMVGISSGAPITAYFAAGDMQAGVKAMTRSCSDKKLINGWRFWNQVDTKRFMRLVADDEEMKLDVNKVFANPARVYLAVAEYKTAKPRILLPKNEEDLFTTMHASINMQNVSPIRIVIDGIHYTDGGFSSPHAIAETMKVIDPTHVLIITNNDRNFEKISWVERLLNLTIFRLRLNGILAQAINTRREARDLAIAGVMNSGIETAVVWGDGSIGGTEKNPAKIEATVEASRTWWHGLLALEK
jgi:predicted patatin/cPLA2 family phospholipase